MSDLKTILARADNQLRKAKIGLPGAIVLATLKGAKPGQVFTPTDMKTRLGRSDSHVHQIIIRLRQKRLVTAQRSGREAHLSLTELGRAVIARVEKAVMDPLPELRPIGDKAS